TGNLDTETSDQVFDLLQERNADSSTAFLIVTHDWDLARRCQRVVELVDGAVVYEGPPAGLRPAK
ncbi:MAG: ABC transporter ATP-binding protein, partial [Polyangiales bacterium]